MHTRVQATGRYRALSVFSRVLTNMEEKDFSYIVRVANTDIDGHKPVYIGLARIKGVGRTLANAICAKTGVEPTARLGNIGKEDVKKLNDVASNLSSNFPAWLLNRRRNYVTGKDEHVIAADLQFSRQADIRQMQKTRSYKGIRHGKGLPVRGQRTKSNFRRNKGKGLGVVKKSQQPAAPAEKK